MAQVVDAQFTPSTNGDVNAVIAAPGGKLLIGGDFTTVNGQARSTVARLNANGSLDTGFVPPIFSDAVATMALMADGRVVVGGEFQVVGGATRRYVARLNPDGSLDNSFQPDISYGAIANVERLAVQTDDKVLIAGRFSTVSGQSRTRLARLNVNGSLDTGFLAQQIDDSVDAITLQADGRILIGGYFDEVNGSARRGLTRLTSTGALDGSFANTGVQGTVDIIALQPDGRILIGGSFGDVGTLTRPFLARVQSNGAVDASFADAGIRFGGSVRQIQPGVDGRIVISGDWRWQGATSGGARVVVLDEFGGRDPGFTDVMMSGYAMSMALQTGGRPVVGGFFTTPRPNLFAINTQDAASVDELQVIGSSVVWLRDGLAPVLLEAPQLESSTDGISYTPVSVMTPVAAGWQVSGFSPPGGASTRYLRARGKVNDGGIIEVIRTPSTEVFRNGFE